MKKQLKGIDENTVVHCPTEGLAKQVLQIAHDAGYRWYYGESYERRTNWECHEERSCYHIKVGRYCTLGYYKDKDYTILPAKEFIEMNTLQQSFNLETYTPKGQLEGFPKEVIKRMLECQVEQGNKEDVSVVEKCNYAGFEWEDTKEGTDFWSQVIFDRNFDLFFEKYPKQDHPKIYTVTREALAEIYAKVCDEWARTIDELMNKSVNKFSNEIEVTTDLIKQAWKEAEPKHKEWLTKNGLELPKEKVTKTLEGWLNIYPDETLTLYRTKESADRRAAKYRLDCVKITIPYQVEE